MLRGILASLLILAAGCQTGGALHWSTLTMSAEAEALAGRRAAPALEDRFGGILDDTRALERMRHIGRRLADSPGGADVDWHFHLLASDKVNAFSLPGGLVYVTRGLYDRIGARDGLLAAVIAHEMAHVAHKDSLKPSACTARQGLERELSLIHI